MKKNELRLIDDEPLRQVIITKCKQHIENEQFVSIMKQFLDLLSLCPTVDAVAVVRCKDCRQSSPSECPKNRVWCQKMGRYMKEDGYCSEGAVKDGF